jgi:ring-1,2-phenylacetyl-CoA epoxidase subunit PaaB
MKDSQWPRYEVFQQDREGRSHRNVGSVHAPDPEMAMQNARDVFVRRPACLSLWVVPAEDIHSKTTQELREESLQDVLFSDEPAELQIYAIFQKTRQRRSMTYVEFAGEVKAASPISALQEAQKQFGEDSAYVWWVCAVEDIFRSNEIEIDSMFSPAIDKSYRMAREYRVLSEMMEAISGRDYTGKSK